MIAYSIYCIYTWYMCVYLVASLNIDWKFPVPVLTQIDYR